VTRGDLAPLFSDLPGALHLDAPTGPYPAAAQPAPGTYGAPAGAAGAPYGYGAPSGPAQPAQPGSRSGLLIVSIMPFVAVILFFLTGMVWGYQYSWLWFLLIPLAGAIVYGLGGGERRR
jgi:hypothetical protein